MKPSRLTPEERSARAELVRDQFRRGETITLDDFMRRRERTAILVATDAAVRAGARMVRAEVAMRRAVERARALGLSEASSLSAELAGRALAEAEIDYAAALGVQRQIERDSGVGAGASAGVGVLETKEGTES